MFDVFTNKAAIERLAKNDRTLAQKIYDKFKDILNIIKSKLKLFDTMNNNPEIRALMNDADSLEQIVNKLHDALDVAKNNYNVHDSGKDAGKAYSINQQLTKINIKGYNIDSKSPLSLENRAKANSNSIIKWVYDAEIFSFEESKLFHQKISEINQGFKSFDKNADDEYMIPIGNKIVFTDGNYDSPYIDRIIEVLDEFSTNFEKVKEVIFDVERGKTGYRDAVQLVNQVFGNGFIVQYKSQTDGVYGWADRNYKRKNRRAVIADYIRKQNREGNAGEGSTNRNLIDSSQKNLSMNSSSKSLDEMKAERSTLQDEYRELKGQIDNLKTSAEYIAFEDEIRKVRKNGSLFIGFEAVKKYVDSSTM